MIYGKRLPATGSRLSDEDRIVFGTSRQDLQYSSDLIITADHGIKFTHPRQFIQVTRIPFQSIVCIFRSL